MARLVRQQNRLDQVELFRKGITDPGHVRFLLFFFLSQQLNPGQEAYGLICFRTISLKAPEAICCADVFKKMVARTSRVVEGAFCFSPSL